MSFITLYDTITVKDPGPSWLKQIVPNLSDGWGRRDEIDMDDPRNAGDYCVYARFKIIEQDFSKGFYCFHTSGTSSCLSLYSMIQGLYHLTAFASGAEISEDFNDITSDQVLRLPMDYKTASKFINDNLIGKTLRVIARSKANSTPYHGRYYIFVIED